MPCYLVQVARIELGQVNPADLAQALKGLGLSVSGSHALSFSGQLNGQHVRGSFSGGTLSLRDVADSAATPFVNTIKRQLSADAIKAAASQFRFNVKQTAANKFVAQKRKA